MAVVAVAIIDTIARIPAMDQSDHSFRSTQSFLNFIQPLSAYQGSETLTGSIANEG